MRSLTSDTATPDSPSGLRSGESTLVPSKGGTLSNLSKMGESPVDPLPRRNPRTWDASGNLTDQERREVLEAAAEKHRRETEAKQKAFLAERQQKLKKHSPVDAGPGIRGQREIDFNQRRDSPYEASKGSFNSTKEFPLVPARAPPPRPPDSQLLLKANSLTKRPGHGSRTS